MKISTKIYILVSLPIITIIGLSVTYYSTFLSLNNVVAQSDIIDTILEDSGNLRINTIEYTQHNYDRVETQWLATHTRMDRLIGTITVESKAQRRYLNLIANRMKNIHALFRELVHNHHEIETTTNKDKKALYTEIEGRTSGQLYSNIGAINSDFLKFKSHTHQSVIKQQNVVIYFIVWPSFLMISLTLLVGLLIHRSIKYPIRELVLATSKLTSGNLGHTIPATSNDELGELAHKFNYMSKTLAHAHNKLRERENNLEVTLNSLGDAVIATDAAGNVTRMNPVAEQITGWSQQEAIGQPLKSIFLIVDTTTRKPLENPIQKVLSKGKIIYRRDHITLIAKDSTEFQITDSAAPIVDPDDKLQGIVLVFNDITEQFQLREAAAKSQRDLQAIMNHSPAVIYVKDTDSRYKVINRQFEKLFDIKLSNIIGKTDYDLFPKEIADEFQRNDKTVLEAGHTLETEETIPQDGRPHTYFSIRFPMFNKNNKMYAICGISTDITKLKLQEEQIRRSQKMDALGKLTGGIAHDYNNMLGIILGYSALLKDDLNEQPKLAKYVGEIQHAGERGAKLTKKLLAFSRNTNADKETFNVNELLQDDQHMLEKTITTRAQLVLDLADDLWLVWLDKSDLEDAIINLSINAMQSINKKGLVTLRTSNEQINTTDAKQLDLEPGDYVLLDITDTGCGIDETTKEKIFEPFYSTKGDKGTGLGLSQVYGFVVRSNGAIKVFSELGHGSRFVLYFPRSHISKSDIQPTTSSEKQARSYNETLLVVDDEPALSELAQAFLTQQGYRVFIANDGKQALKVLETETIDLVLSDIVMPNMDGYQLAAQVQQLYPHIKLQLVSGFASNRDHNTIDDTLYQNRLVKPYSSNTLLTRVRSLLDEGSAKEITRAI